MNAHDGRVDEMQIPICLILGIGLRRQLGPHPTSDACRM